MTRTHHLFASLTVLALLAGCEGSGGKATLDDSIAAYDRGDYSQSLELASKTATEASSSRDQEEAAYLAGMSAYRLGKWSEAERWLTQATQSGDAWVAGQAGVTLGSAQLKMGNAAAAARSFSRAADKLSGDDAKKARIASANAYREAGDSRMADTEFKRANVPTTTVSAPAPEGAPPQARPSPKSAPSAASAQSGPYVLQAGAFRDESKARQRASDLRGKAVQSGFGEPRVLTKRGNDGATLFIVQIGSFNDRRAADAAVSRLGASGVVVGKPASAS